MNLPNQLTLLRILLIPLILLFLLPMPDGFLWPGWNHMVLTAGPLVSFLLFLVAALTDLFDGRVARKRGQVTNLGKFLDPIADKLLVVSVLIVLVQQNRVHALIAIIIVVREFVVTGIRLIGSEKGLVIAAGKLGKAKTVTQIIALLLLLIEPMVLRLTAGAWAPEILYAVNNSVLMLAVLMTVLSGISYAYHYRSVFRS